MRILIFLKKDAHDNMGRDCIELLVWLLDVISCFTSCVSDGALPALPDLYSQVIRAPGVGTIQLLDNVKLFSFPW